MRDFHSSLAIFNDKKVTPKNGKKGSLMYMSHVKYFIQ